MKLADLQQKEFVPSVEPLKVSMESIAYQHNDPFGPLLESLFLEYMKLVDDGATAEQVEGNQELKKRFENAIYDRLGIKVVFICDKQLAACMPNVYVSHSAVLRDAMRKLIEPYGVMMGITELRSKASGDSLGTVNTEKAKITGWLGQQPIPLFMNFHELKNYKVWNSAELTAICLHELGHIFDSAAKAYTVNNANQIIQDVVKHITDKDRGGDIEYIYKELSKLDPELKKETVEGIKSGNAVVFGISAFRVIQGTVRSISGSKTYDKTSSEALADNFAVRFGYGEPLAVGLEKIMNDPSMVLMKAVIQALNTYAYIFIVKSLYFTLVAVAGGAALSVMGLYSLIFNIFGLYALTVANRHSTQDYEYDKNPDRMRRITNDLIGSLKDPHISKETKLSILEQIKTVNEVRSKVFEIPNLIQAALLLLFSSDRKSYASVKAQQQIESLLANQLFVQAAKLETKA